MNLLDQQIHCPYCGEPLEIYIDPSIEQQQYVEDCQVCCAPILISVVLDDGLVSTLSVEQENG